MNEATAARMAALQEDLSQKLGALEDCSLQNQALSSENEALRGHLEHAEDRMQMLEHDHATTQAGSLRECRGIESWTTSSQFGLVICLPRGCASQDSNEIMHSILGRLRGRSRLRAACNLMRGLKRQRQ